MGSSVSRRYLERLALQRITARQWEEANGDPASVQRLLDTIIEQIKAETHENTGAPAGVTERELWRKAVLRAVQRHCRNHGRDFMRQAFMLEQLDRVVLETRSRGATPAQTLSRVLQELRPTVQFMSRGEYRYVGDL